MPTHNPGDMHDGRESTTTTESHPMPRAPMDACSNRGTCSNQVGEPRLASLRSPKYNIVETTLWMTAIHTESLPMHLRGGLGPRRGEQKRHSCAQRFKHASPTAWCISRLRSKPVPARVPIPVHSSYLRCGGSVNLYSLLTFLVGTMETLLLIGLVSSVVPITGLEDRPRYECLLIWRARIRFRI